MKLLNFLFLLVNDDNVNKSLYKFDIPSLEMTSSLIKKQLQRMQLISTPDKQPEPIIYEQIIHFHDAEAEEYEWKYLENIKLSQLRYQNGQYLDSDSTGNISKFENDDKYLPKIKALAVITEDLTYIGFQRKNANTIFHKKPILSFFTPNRVEEKVANQIVLGEEFDIIYCKQSKKLYFRSFFVANLIFNLDEHAPLINEERFNKLFTDDLFIIGERETIFKKFGKRTKKKMAVIEYNNRENDGLFNMLRNDSGDKWNLLKSYAEIHGLEDAIDCDKKKIIFPDLDKQILKLCQVIDEDFFVGYYSQNNYLSNSKAKAQ